MRSCILLLLLLLVVALCTAAPHSPLQEEALREFYQSYQPAPINDREFLRSYNMHNVNTLASLLRYGETLEGGGRGLSGARMQL